MALAEERKVDALAAGLLSVAAFMTVTPYSVGEAYAVALTGWAARILSPVLLLAWWSRRCLHLLSGATG
ncbi:PTS system, cellobiose-specific IIC component [Salmonella enterica subsp. enterica]|uniref:PTS system, cellobiose-specific IIC component n=1 Tax=Salmonella enterica I TaxID=59201 RepID=A0A379WVR6_SALET|nr:PTS system, cellobiose-specific IIC component [Salmonella enterica subsp. enterica]